jgi:hypothetical protein
MDDEDDVEDEAYIVSKRAAATPALKKALETFEGNVTHYAQNPGANAVVAATAVAGSDACWAEELLKLSSTLPTVKEQNDFLDILFAGTPAPVFVCVWSLRLGAEMP